MGKFPQERGWALGVPVFSFTSDCMNPGCGMAMNTEEVILSLMEETIEVEKCLALTFPSFCLLCIHLTQ